MPLAPTLPDGLHGLAGDERQRDDGQDRRRPVAAVEDVHRVLILFAADEERDRDDGGQEAERADDEREEDPGRRVRPAGRLARWCTRRRPGSWRRCSRRRSTRTGRRRGRRSRRRCRRRGPRSRPRCGGRPRGCPSRPCRRGRSRRPRPWCRCRRPAGRTGRRSWRRSRSRRSGTAPALTVSPLRPPKAAKMPHTPSSDRATTRKPETAPPRIATWTASTRLRRAAAAVRTLDLTLMYMPMMPGRHRARRTDQERDAGPDAEVDAEDVGVGDLLGLEHGDDDDDDHGAHEREHRRWSCTGGG